MMPSDYKIVENMTEGDFTEHLKRQNGDKRVWLMALRRYALSQDADEFLENWNALGLAGNRFARQWAEELLKERRKGAEPLTGYRTRDLSNPTGNSA